MSDCRVYWGSHGCSLERGHDGPHMCSCAWDGDGNLLPHINYDEDGEWTNVGAPPYYGERTAFWGEDAPKNDANETHRTPDAAS